MPLRSVCHRILGGVALVSVGIAVGCAPSQAGGDPGALRGTAETSVARTLSEGTLPDEAVLRDEVTAALEGTGIPGGAVTVRNAEGEARTMVFGEADEGEPVTESTRFAYRSVTKSFVGMVVLQMADEGLVDLDDPVTDYLPDLELDDSPTLRELATMRSGIANYSAMPALGEMLLTDPTREPAADELIALALPATPVFSPGEAYEYSNTNTLLLGEVIEVVTGADWFAEVSERLLEPLGLDAVGYGFAGDEPEAVPVHIGSDGDLDELPSAAPGWFGAAGGLTGDVEDLAAWGHALGSGATLSDPLHEERLNSFGPTDDDAASPYYDEYGLAIGEIKGWVGHTGAGLGFQALTMHHPGTDITVAMLLRGTGEDQDVPADVFVTLIE